MRVEPELPDHPKFLRLEKLVGPDALKCLIRLWGHCQQSKRGEFWPGADADYLELVCRWNGEPGLLHRSMASTGFVVSEQGGLRIHDWAEMNAKIVGNWANGKLGGLKKNPTRTQVKPNVEPNSELGSTGSNGGSTGHPQPNPTRTQTGIGLTQTEPNANPVNGTRRNETERNEPEGSAEGDDYALASRVIDFLNETTGSRFNPPLHELDGIVSRLLETNRDVAGIERMISRQAALWQGDSKCRQWLKPSTLFGEKFHDYYGQRDLPVAGGPDDVRRLQELVDTSPANPESVHHNKKASAEDRAQLEQNKKALAALVQQTTRSSRPNV